ncbi:hypothetical protein DKX38_006869 [Salix brachista]|uniref:Retrotransposon Copia-like N-terminal domain-containing protein n=1 Tax=Salix brachista TaxID=2182728 RepID=A0A5N5MLB5_9ROSI|nr:hypothetical protein DKX38_006869 [Salix brachista]
MNLVPKVLDGTNYAMWRRSMLISLSAKNKLGFINGTILTPNETDSKYMLWQRCNDMVLSWILNSLNQEIANKVLYVETPSEIWLDLQERFSQGSILIVAVLWGKDKELKEEIDDETEVTKLGNKEWNNHDLELQSHAISNGNI